MIPIPATKGDLTPEWFTSILRLMGNNHVKSIDLQPLGESDSVSGEIYRARLTYSDKAPDNPKSVILKLPRPRSLRTKVNIDSYKNEVTFYRTLAPKVGVMVPKHIYSDIDPETNDYILIIQDFPSSKNIRNETGANKEQAYKLIEYMAKLHAWNWCNQELEDILPGLDSSIEAISTGLDRLPVFLSRFSEYIYKEEMEVYQALPNGFRDAVHPLLFTPMTIIHNDFALKNILVVDGDEEPSFVLVDWAMVRWGPGVRDLSHFVRTSVPLQTRPLGEIEFVRQYLACLVDMGVSGYSYEQLLDDYRRCVIMDMARIAFMGGRENFSPVYESIVRQGVQNRAGSARTLDLGSLFK